MCIQSALIVSALESKVAKPDRVHIESIHFRMWIESRLEVD